MCSARQHPMNPSGQLIGWHDIAELTQQFGRDRNIVWAKQSNLHGTVGLTYLQGLERSLSTSTKSAMGHNWKSSARASDVRCSPKADSGADVPRGRLGADCVAKV